MSEIPEIERLRRAIAEVAYADQPQIDSSTYPHGYFPFEEASQSYRDAAYALADEIMVPIRSALDRQAREIVEALRSPECREFDGTPAEFLIAFGYVEAPVDPA